MASEARILVTGSRDWWDRVTVRGAMLQAADEFPAASHVLVHGAAVGADLIAMNVALELGWRIESHPAEWRVFGKAAGFVRNQAMVDLGAAVCLAFFMPCRRSCGQPGPHDSHGASDCAARALGAGISVRSYHQDLGVPA